MGLLRNGSEGVAAEAAGLVAVLIGGGPGDTNILTDSKGEQHATIMHTKSVLFAHQGYVIILANRLKPMSVSPLLSMAIVEVLEAMICDPHGETTQYPVFVELLRQVAGLKRRLFALFGHPAESVRETVAVIMRTIAEEDAIAAESMRDAALRDGALLRHLLHAFFLPAGERREVSRQLVALWADSYQPALDLLSRVLPPGLVAYLHTRSDGVLLEDSNQEVSLTGRRQRRLLQQRRGRTGRGATSQEHSLSSVNNYDVGDPITQTSGDALKLSDNYERSAMDPSSGQAPTIQPSGAQTGENLTGEVASTGAPKNNNTPFVASADAQSTGIHASLAANTAISTDSDSNVAGVQNTGLPAPAQVVVENTPVWVRQELREALQAEVHKLDVEKERTEDIVPGGATVDMTGQDIGLTVDGAVPDEMGASDDWCDMGRLDGFGGGGGFSVRELCARAMTIVYEQHYKTVGPFEGTAHITVLLDRTDDRALRHRLLLLLKALMKVLSNVEACVLVGGCVLGVDMLTAVHEASERTAIPLQSNLIAATAFMEPLKEWMFVDKEGAQVGPVEKDAIRRFWSKKAIDWTTRCWASGMLDWKRLRDIRELRWALAVRVAVLTPAQVGEAALSILHSMVSAHSDLDDAGEIVTPTPRVKWILSSPRCLPHIAQAMLSGEPSIVEGVLLLY
ncbi:hypothetical protein M0R45_001011 [Rubus argutus]|uniref:Uncharacterized protein n=1 Tax=Rubus argutus TaxID=59490 RepID=A0AAW1VNF4_RUBAR